MNKELLQFKPLRDVPYNEMERLLKVSSIKNNKLIWLHFIKSFKQLYPSFDINKYITEGKINNIS